MDLVRIQSGIAHFARSFYEKPYGFFSKTKSLPFVTQRAIARIKIGCAPTMFSILGTNNGNAAGQP